MAARLEAMGQEKYSGLAMRVGNVGKWTGVVRFDDAVLGLPLRTRKPGRWFLTSMGDIAHEAVTDEQIASAFDVMARANWHTFLVLTKRAERFASLLKTSPLPNVHIGCTAENQQQADKHRPHMQSLSARGWQTFVSYEPALGPVDWTGWEFLQQLISGGESGHGARPASPDWHRAARDFAYRHGIAYLFKQWGDWLPMLGQVEGVRVRKKATTPDGWVMGWAGKKAAGRTLDGLEHNGFPPHQQPSRFGG
jgi:protein gp37